MARGLTEKQRRFVEAYMGEAKGNATEAARLAGYKGNNETLHVTAHEVLSNPKVAAEIQARVKKDPSIKKGKELREWWSKLVDDANVETQHRLKASEYLAKSQRMFVERRELTGNKGGPIRVRAEDMTDNELAAIAKGEK